MADVLLIKNLNEDQLNNIIPVTIKTNISDRDKLVGIFNCLIDEKLVETNRLAIKKSSITIDLISSKITEVIQKCMTKMESP